jgi:hypothetical protein
VSIRVGLQTGQEGASFDHKLVNTLFYFLMLIHWIFAFSSFDSPWHRFFVLRAGAFLLSMAGLICAFIKPISSLR